MSSIKRLIYDYHFPTSYLIRDIMEKSTSSKELVEWSKNSMLVSPCYMIIGTPNNGYIVERDHEKTSNLYQLGTDPSSYLIQKNADNILWTYQRMDILKLSLTTVINHLLVQGYVKNKHTIYISKMIPETGEVISDIVV